MDAATIAAAAAALFLACGVSGYANFTNDTTTNSSKTGVTLTTGSSVSTNQISTTSANEGTNAGVIAAAVVVPLVVIGVALAVYFLWFRHWLRQCRQKRLDDSQGQDKEQIDATAAGDSAQHAGQLRYSKNPRKQHQQQTESATLDYAAVDRQSVSSNDDCGSALAYENFTPRAADKEGSHEMYENVRSESSATAAKKVTAKKETAGATGDKKKARKLPGPTAKDAVPDHRAPVPPPQDGRGGSSSLSPAASAKVDSSEQDDGTAAYVKLVGIAQAKQQPAKTKVPPQFGPKNLPGSSQASGNAPYSSNLQPRQQSQQVLQTSAGTAAAVGKPSKGYVPTVALRPPGCSSTDNSESEITEDDTYVVPDAGAADHAAPPSKQPPSAATSEDGTDVYVEPQGDDVYENY